MHPLEKIIIFLALCQILQTAYLAAHVHRLHGASRRWYVLKMAPLIVLTVALALMTARIVFPSLVPYIGI